MSSGSAGRMSALLATNLPPPHQAMSDPGEERPQGEDDAGEDHTSVFIGEPPQMLRSRVRLRWLALKAMSKRKPTTGMAPSAVSAAMLKPMRVSTAAVRHGAAPRRRHRATGRCRPGADAGHEAQHAVRTHGARGARNAERELVNQASHSRRSMVPCGVRSMVIEGLVISFISQIAARAPSRWKSPTSQRWAARGARTGHRCGEAGARTAGRKKRGERQQPEAVHPKLAGEPARRTSALRLRMGGPKKDVCAGLCIANAMPAWPQFLITLELSLI